MLEVKENRIYAGNDVNETLVKAATQLLECFPAIDVSFNVIGRTMHECLAHQLYNKLDTKALGADIDYMSYKCHIYKKPIVTIVTIEVQYKDALHCVRVHRLVKAFTKPENVHRYVDNVVKQPTEMKKVLGTLFVEGDTFVSYGDIRIETTTLD